MCAVAPEHLVGNVFLVQFGNIEQFVPNTQKTLITCPLDQDCDSLLGPCASVLLCVDVLKSAFPLLMTLFFGVNIVRKAVEISHV